jgi:predicted anti-sigma-YlaC factor YlaD
MTGEHPHDLLEAYGLGVLEGDEELQVEQHLAGCSQCRKEFVELQGFIARLRQVPPEAFVDGPPVGADLLLARAVRQARAEQRRPMAWMVAAAFIVVLAALGGGLLLGHRGNGPPSIAAPAGSERLVATNHATGVHMAVVVIPAKGWVRLEGAFTGVPASARCYLIVVDKTGHRFVAGSWLAPAVSPPGGERVDGSALVAPGDVAAVQVVTFAGQVLGTARV